MKTYLSIDVGGTAIKYGLLHENGTILSTDTVPTPKDSIEGFYKTLDEIVSPVLQMISGIAMSMPGRIDNQTGHVHTGGAISSYMTNVPFGSVSSRQNVHFICKHFMNNSHPALTVVLSAHGGVANVVFDKT